MGKKKKKKTERKVFIEQEASMLNIDQPKHWLLLVFVSAFLIILFVWSIFGRIPTEATGRSVSLSSGGVFSMQAKTTGTISKLYIVEGNEIVKGMALAKVNKPQLRSIVTSIESTKFKINRLQAEAVLLNHALTLNASLYSQGLIAKMVIDSSKSNLYQKYIEIAETEAALNTLFSDLENNSFASKDTFNKQKSILEVPDRLINFQSVVDKLSTITAPSDGKALEVLINEGDVISEKELIFWMEYPKKPLCPEIFYGTLQSDTLGRLKTNLKVLIEPATVNPREYGAIIGKIKSINPYPVSKEELIQSIGNMQIIEYLLAEGSTMTQIVIEPNQNKDTISGYEWTSGKGPPFNISAGTLCNIRVVVEEQPPISYLIPLWKIKLS